MPLPLLQTKLYVPTARPNFVARSHLSKRLSADGVRPFTLISAPAGFGKTTLISSWLAGMKQGEKAISTPAPCPLVAWLSLDEDDNDPARLMAYLIGALQSCSPQVGESTLLLLDAPQAPPLKTILTQLINELGMLNTLHFLVLDDYHLITAPAIHEALTFLIDHLPANLRLVITTRVDPPLPLSRWRVRQQLLEIRADDLRFSAAEAAIFLNEIMGLTLKAEEITTLDARTEGWIAGLQLAALSLQGTDDAQAFIDAFSGSNRYIIDYLVEEVLNRQPQHIQTFLMQTAMLERFCAPLCDAVLGDWASAPDSISQRLSQPILTQLEAANLFLIPLDQNRCWYRYHHLFADVLRNRRSLTQPEPVAELHRRASQWYAQNNLLPESIAHGLAGEDYAQTAHLIEQVAQEMFWRHGEVHTLLHWLKRLPEEIVQGRPWLSLTYAWLLMWTEHSDVAERFLQAARREGEKDITEGRAAVLAVATAIEAALAHSRNQLSAALLLAQQALNHFANASLAAELHGVSLGMVAGIYRTSGDIRTAIQLYTEASQIMQQMGQIVPTLVAWGYLIQLHVLQGSLGQAADLFQQASRWTSERHAQSLPTYGVVQISMAQVLYEWNDLERASQHTEEGIGLCQQWEGLADDTVTGYLILARIKQAQDDGAGAFTAIQTAAQIVQLHHLDQLRGQVTGTQVRLWLAQNHLTAAVDWATHLFVYAELSFAQQELQLVLARVRLAQGKADEALRLLKRLLSPVEATGLIGWQLEILILQACAAYAQKNMAQALLSLNRALSLAESMPGVAKHVRIFLNEGVAMQRLLSEYRLRIADYDPHLRTYVEWLLAAFDDKLTKWQEDKLNLSAAPAVSLSLLEPLSDREREVLRLVATGLSTTEIADTLVIAVGTVRTHLKSIYGKLDAHSRIQAVERARTLQLL